MDISVRVDGPHPIGNGHSNYIIHVTDEEGFKIGEITLNNEDELKHLVEELNKLSFC